MSSTDQENGNGTPTVGEENKVEALIVYVVNENSEIIGFKVWPHTKLLRLKKYYARRMEVSMRELKFFCKEDTEIGDNDTAGSLGLHDGDRIDVLYVGGTGEDGDDN